MVEDASQECLHGLAHAKLLEPKNSDDNDQHAAGCKNGGGHENSFLKKLEAETPAVSRVDFQPRLRQCGGNRRGV